MKRDPLDGIMLDVATGVIDYLDSMYPAALQAVPSSAPYPFATPSAPRCGKQ